SPSNLHADAMCQLSNCPRYHAQSLITRGESDRARKELEEDSSLLESAPVAETAFPEYALSKALNLAALGRWSGEFTAFRSSGPMQPAYADMARLEIYLAELEARRTGFLPSIVKSPLHIAEDLTKDAWVDRVILSIKSDVARFDIDHSRIPTIASTMS